MAAVLEPLKGLAFNKAMAQAWSQAVPDLGLSIHFNLTPVGELPPLFETCFHLRGTLCPYLHLEGCYADDGVCLHRVIVDHVSSQGLVRRCFPALIHGPRSLEQISAVSFQVLAGSDPRKIPALFGLLPGLRCVCLCFWGLGRVSGLKAG